MSLGNSFLTSSTALAFLVSFAAPAQRYVNAGQKARIDGATQEIRTNPRDATGYVRRAFFYMEFSPGGGKPPLPNMDLAVADLEKAIRLDPRSYTARHNYAHAAYLLGYDDFAVSEFNKAIALNPSGARSFLGRGWAQFESCRFDNAGADFTRAVRLDPSLRAEVASQQRIVSRKNECAALDYAAAHPPPSSSPGMPNLGKIYERAEAERRASQADSRGDHEAARIERGTIH